MMLVVMVSSALIFKDKTLVDNDHHTFKSTFFGTREKPSIFLKKIKERLEKHEDIKHINDDDNTTPAPVPIPAPGDGDADVDDKLNFAIRMVLKIVPFLWGVFKDWAVAQLFNII